MVADDATTCLEGQKALISTLRSLGFYIAWNKTSYPSTLCRYLGINIDSMQLRLSLPEDKILKLHSELEFWVNRRYATKKQMQRLCGTLNYCCKVVRGGRAFMHNMISLLPCFSVRRRLSLPNSFFDELDWWRSYATIFNGEADIIDTSSNTVELYTDASLSGLAGVAPWDYFTSMVYSTKNSQVAYVQINDNEYITYIPEDQVLNINVLELVAVYLSLERWQHELQDSRVIINCDNQQVCYMLCRDRSRNLTASILLRHIFWICVSRNLYVSPQFISSVDNTTADYLSRIYA